MKKREFVDNVYEIRVPFVWTIFKGWTVRVSRIEIKKRDLNEIEFFILSSKWIRSARIHEIKINGILLYYRLDIYPTIYNNIKNVNNNNVTMILLNWITTIILYRYYFLIVRPKSAISSIDLWKTMLLLFSRKTSTIRFIVKI